MTPLVKKIEQLLGFALQPAENVEDIFVYGKTKLYLLDTEQRLIGLNVKDCQLQNLDFVAHLPDLLYLNCNQNQLTDLTPLANLQNLQELRFGDNQVVDISPLANLNNLQILTFAKNQVVDISPLANLNNLQGLDFANNQVIAIFPLANLQDLQILSFHDNQVNDISPLVNLQKLQSLWIDNNQVVDISPLANLQNLQELWIDNNQVVDISPLANLGKLERLEFSSNQVVDISPLANLQNLHELRFNYNQVVDISPLANLQNLQELSSNYNQVVDISPLANLQKLDWLEIANNAIKQLPDFVTQLDWWNFQHEGNPFSRYFPKGLEFEHTKAEIDYLLALQANSKPLREAKVVLVGEGLIGKTTLLHWLLYGKKPPQDGRTDKIEILHDTEHFTYANDPLTVHFWDFGGQDIMHATHKFFMTERTVYLLITNQRNLQEYALRDWLNQLQTVVGNSPIILVANHCDSPDDKHRLKDQEYRHEYPKLKFWDKVIHTSGATGRGITDLHQAIQEALQRLEYLHHLIPTPFFSAKEKLLALKKPYIYYQDFENICQAIAQEEGYDFGENMQDVLAKLLHDLGILLSFKEKASELESLKVFQPEWIINGLYALVVQSNNELGKQKGILTKKMAENILKAKGYKGVEIGFILGMLKEFELAYTQTVCNEEKYFIPSVFDDNRPFDLLESWDKPAPQQPLLRFRYLYDNWRTDLINYVIVQEHQQLKEGEQEFWKYGAILYYTQDDKLHCEVLVEARNSEKCIDFTLRGNGDLRLALAHFRKKLMPVIHKKFENLNPQEYILYKEENSPEIPIDYQELIELLDMGETHKPITQLKKRIPIRTLLGQVDLPEEPAEVKYNRLLREIEELLENGDSMADVFDKIQELEKENWVDATDIIQLKNEFIQGKTDINFLGRLKVAVQKKASKFRK